MTLRVIPLKAQSGLKFDLVFESYHVVTLHISDAELAQNPGLSERSQIEKKVLDYLDDNGYTVDSLYLYFY